MNTRILYMYRDAGNNKVYGDVVIHGTFTESQLEWINSLLSRFPENGFLPDKVGLPGLQENFLAGSSYDSELDHDWHELEGVEVTGDEPSLKLSAKEVVQHFSSIEKEGWDQLDSIF